MSAIYNLEPPTKGKVVIKTTLGDIDIELWPKEAPKAVRNFVQLCLEGYYDDTIFHRVIKNFMVQGGDPTGTGLGGESIYGAPFKDEFHQRIKFNHRGLVACANENQAHSNGSQFFLTLEACPHLDRKHTIFGKVVGDSIYNVAHFNELETNDDDRPLQPPKIISIDVLWNPFEDIVPRSTKEDREEAAAIKRHQEDQLRKLLRAKNAGSWGIAEDFQLRFFYRAREEEALRQEKKKRKKNLGLLSFGQEAEEEDVETEAVAGTTKLRSAFDVADSDDPRLVKDGTEAAERMAAEEAAAEAERRRIKSSIRAALAGPADHEEGGDPSDDRLASGRRASTSEREGEAGDDFAARMRAQALERRSARDQAVSSAKAAAAAVAATREEEEEAPVKEKKIRRLKEKQREALLAGKIAPAGVRISKLIAQQDTSLMSDSERRRLAAKQRSKAAQSKGDNVAALLAFKKRLTSDRQPAAEAAAEVEVQNATKTQTEGYDGKPKEGPDPSLPAAWRIDKFLDDYEDESLESLARHKLRFEKEDSKRDAMAANFDDDYVVHDPLADRNEKWNRKEGAAKRSKREWAIGAQGPLD